MRQVADRIAAVDRDGSGKLDFDEFVHLILSRLPDRSESEELQEVL